MSSVAETSRLKDDSNEPLSRRRGLRLVARLVEKRDGNKAAEKNPKRSFNIAICDKMFSPVKDAPQDSFDSETSSSDLSPSESLAPRSIKTSGIISPTGIAVTLLAGGILGFLIGRKRK